METWEDYQQAKVNLLAYTVGRLQVLAEEGWYKDRTEAHLQAFRELAAETVAKYDALTWPAAKVQA